MALVLGCFVLPPCLLLLLPLAWLELGGNWKGVLPITLCAFFTAYGLFALLAQVGGLHLVSESFEWPLLSTAGTVENSHGQRFVPISCRPGRVQVYDREGEFLRGWFVPTSGGIFKLHVSQDDNLEVFTARGNLHLTYATDGTLLDKAKHHGDYDRQPTGPACHFKRRSVWYLWPLASWLLALLLFGVGILGVGLMLSHPRLQHAPRSQTTYLSSATMVFSDPHVSAHANDSDCNSTCQKTELAANDSEFLQNPPPGAWYQQTAEGFSLGASTRSPIAFAYVPFVCILSSVNLGWMYGTQIMWGEFHLATSLIGIPLIILSIVLGTIGLMMVCGKVVVTVNKDKGTVFEGIGWWGWTRSFNWSDVRVIWQEGACTHYLGADNGGIVLEGAQRLRFGTNLTEKRRVFVLNALRYLKATGR